MALDHVRHYIHADATLFEPTEMDKTHPVLFFTRWITHFCAPTFVLLSGVAARISAARKTKKELALFLLSRGLWLILLEITVIRFAFVFNFYYDFTIFQVIWVIGASMVVLSGLIFLPERLILIIGLLLIFGHNALDAFQLKNTDNGYLLWIFLQQTGFYALSPDHGFFVGYPLIPWLGIMVAGYGLGSMYTKNFDADKRKRFLWIAGITTVVLFIALRSINAYGDEAPWRIQKNGVFTLMSFFNCTKYPVSLLYTLMTMGPVLIILAWMDDIKGKTWKPLIVFGRVPLLYYILHFYIIHAGALFLYMFSHNIPLAEIDFHVNRGFGGIPAGIGYTLPWVYVAWIVTLILLYPLCKWYYDYKRKHTYWWLSYL